MKMGVRCSSPALRENTSVFTTGLAVKPNELLEGKMEKLPGPSPEWFPSPLLPDTFSQKQIY